MHNKDVKPLYLEKTEKNLSKYIMLSANKTVKGVKNTGGTVSCYFIYSGY